MPNPFRISIPILKTKLKSLELFRQPLISIRRRICHYTVNLSAAVMISVNDYISDMITFIDIVMANARGYFDYGDGSIRRKTSSGGIVFASNDTDNILQAAIICIKVIDKHNKLK